MVQIPHPLLVGKGALLALLAACAGSSQAAPGTAQSPPPPPPSGTAVPAASPLPKWLSVDSAARTVTLSLEVTAPPGAPSALINGSRAGQARIVVPLNWTVKWNWRNADSTARHSLVWMVQREKLPLEGGQAAFSNAMTRTPVEGLPVGQTDQTTFVAEEAGWFWLLCGVPSHALNGEWLELRVDPEATTATAKIKSVNGNSKR